MKNLKKPDINIIDRLNENKSRLGYLLLFLLALAFIVRFTPLIRFFWINWISAFIVKNWLWLLLISVLLLILGKMEEVMFEKKLEEERRKTHE